jgi:hypothetical protein
MREIEAAIEKQGTDPGAVFESWVIAGFKAVRASSPADYARQRKRAEELGADVVELDRMVRGWAGTATLRYAPTQTSRR